MKIKSIKHFCSAFDVIDEYFNIADETTEADRDTLRGFDAFDGMQYTVIEHAAKCIKHISVIISDAVNGDVLDETTLEEFKHQTLEYVRNELI